MQKPIIAVCVEDLMFRSKIEATAKQIGIDCILIKGDQAALPELAHRVALVILDLNHKRLDALAWLRRFKGDAAMAGIPVLGFLSHVQTDLKRQAVEERCDMVMPRSVFSAQLPQLLERYTKVRLAHPS